MGGMSEKVTDGVNGLYFRRRDPYALADVMQQAIRTPGLWEELREGIPPLRRLDERMAAMIAHYRRLIAERALASDERRLQPETVPNA